MNHPIPEITRKSRKRVQRLKILTILLLVSFVVMSIARVEQAAAVLSPAVAFFACLLILLSKDTQGHYRRISLCYAIGIGIWFLADLLLLIQTYAFPGNADLRIFVFNLFLVPDCFFALGLIFFALSEYNFLHFQRMILSTFAIAFFTFLIAQKLILNALPASHSDLFGAVLYFFVIVFTIVLVIIIFFQTNFKGHTTGTNFSAVFLVIYNLLEIRMIYLRMTGVNPWNRSVYALYVVGIVVYAMAQSDPNLVYRKPEAKETETARQMKNRTVWFIVIPLLVIGIVLFLVGFLDSRDMYFGLIAILAYVMVYKTMQANALNEQLLKRQKEENRRLEGLVEEKTRELQEINDYLFRISTTDPLTGLYNRRYGLQKIRELSEASPPVPFAIYQMDLNYFKTINDTYGHDAGDLVLKEVGKRLLHMMPENVTAVRMGGDEFLLILEKADSPEKIKEVAALLCKWMDEPVETPCYRFAFSASIGIACWPESTKDLETLYKFADDAMYRIKHSSEKSGYLFWETEK